MPPQPVTSQLWIAKASMCRRALTIALALAGAGALAGCGRADDRAAVGAVTQRFFAALAAGDGAAACAALSPDTRAQVASQEKRPCPRAITGLGLRSGAPARVQVYITNAKADLSTGEAVFLGHGAQGWSISAVGCAPQGGKPADRPYDCEVEA